MDIHQLNVFLSFVTQIKRKKMTKYIIGGTLVILILLSILVLGPKKGDPADGVHEVVVTEVLRSSRGHFNYGMTFHEMNLTINILHGNPASK